MCRPYRIKETPRIKVNWQVFAKVNFHIVGGGKGALPSRYETHVICFGVSNWHSRTKEGRLFKTEEDEDGKIQNRDISEITGRFRAHEGGSDIYWQ